MDGFGKYLGLPIFLLLATWGAYETVLKVLENLNATRGMIIMSCRETPQPGAILSGVALADHVLWADWVPLWIGFVIFLGVYAAVLCFIPTTMHQVLAVGRRRGGAKAEVDDWIVVMTAPRMFRLSHVQIACYGLAALTALVIAGVIVGGSWTTNSWLALSRSALVESRDGHVAAAAAEAASAAARRCGWLSHQGHSSYSALVLLSPTSGHDEIGRLEQRARELRRGRPFVSDTSWHNHRLAEGLRVAGLVIQHMRGGTMHSDGQSIEVRARAGMVVEGLGLTSFGEVKCPAETLGGDHDESIQR